ncbi:sigma-70 family RNA polymerase sigma factor [Streptomyces sp. WMMC500]|uniref:RNA polymerase sigma factor n=1 Tax=Streptomyces sp. WMMC500 TaxID=3015154 RepID=UPI00248D168B|nr:sigma-70 family RNA polymerase sigma factor [Streptomyces sp. WMMC500]WBB61094.1 sigma-70 family RNA polymerase sigma factor [Streptomyces sp. WMMC500]
MTEADAPIAEAIRAARAGDETAFVLLYRTVHPCLVRYVGTLVGDAAGDGDAEEVTAGAWREIARELPAFGGDAIGFRAWCARIARTRALAHLRDRPAPRARGPQSPGGGPPPGRGTGTGPERPEGGRTLALIAWLPRAEADAVALRAIVGLDAERAAYVLGTSPAAARSATLRGLRLLADQLGDAAAGALQSGAPAGDVAFAATWMLRGM